MKRIAFLLLCIAPSIAQAYEQDVSISCGVLKPSYQRERTFTCGVVLSHGFTDWFALNAVYLNEGHPDNHHRDGFAIQPSVYRDFNRWRLQLSSGPYYSMDTTRRADDVVLHDKNLGVLTSLTLKWHPGPRDWYLGIGYNHVWMPNKLNSNSVLLLAGTDTNKGSGTGNAGYGSKMKGGLWIGSANTTSPGSEVSGGGQLEVEFPHTDRISYSVAGLYEGNTTLANRKGVMAQAWYKEKFKNWTFSAGAGPYLGHDSSRSARATKLLGVASFRATYQLTGRTEIGLNFNRVISFYHKDADMFMLGIQRAF